MMQTISSALNTAAGKVFCFLQKIERVFAGTYIDMTAQSNIATPHNSISKKPGLFLEALFTRKSDGDGDEGEVAGNEVT
jgi:hypothetical protein